MNAIGTSISDDDGRCVMLVGCPGFNVWKVGGLLHTVCRPLGWCLGLLGHLRVEPWCKTAAVLCPMVD